MIITNYLGHNQNQFEKQTVQLLASKVQLQNQFKSYVNHLIFELNSYLKHGNKNMCLSFSELVMALLM